VKAMNRASRTAISAAILAIVAVGIAENAPAQHVTATMAAPPGEPGCEERARQASTLLGALNGKLERARQTNDEAEMRAAADAAQKGFADLRSRLAACRAAAAGPAPSSAAPPPAVAPAPAAGAVDHAAMGHGAPVGAAAAPTALRQISGPAEAALQSFQDALQIGNREVALRWLAPDVTITEAGATDESRHAYANRHIGIDMAFLKTAKIVLLDRQVHPGDATTHIVSTSRITGRAGEMPVEVTVTEAAVLKKTPEGWHIVSLEWSVEPVIQKDV